MVIDIINVKFSVQVGLLGNVFPELRAVSVDSKENLIQVYFYVDGEISDEQRECCECVLDDIIADFFLTKKYDEKGLLEFEYPVIRLDAPKKPPLVGHWVYYRYEPLPSIESSTAISQPMSPTISLI